MPDTRFSLVRWHTAPCAVPQPWQGWCFSYDSLTARLTAHCGSLTVRPVGQGRRAIFWEERSLLTQRLRQAWVREVVLYAEDRAVVFARSVLPFASASAWPLFFRAGMRPLGALLFTDPLIYRGPLAAAAIGQRHYLWQRAEAAGIDLTAALHRLWARRSLFWRKGKPLLVQELFLPEFAP